jgi:uncharacterized repeat protein (TIGR01451 family)
MQIKRLYTRLLATTGLLASLVVAPLVATAATPAFNNLAGDQEFMQGRNVSRNSGFSDPVAASAGEEVDVAVYYHNAVVDTVAKNVRIKVTLPTAESTSHLLTGQLSADNASSVSGTVISGQELGKPGLTITSGSNTKVQFVPGSVRWYPNRMDTNGKGANLPAGVNGDKIVTEGINLGDVNGCFQYAGFVIFKVKLTAQNITPTAILQVSKQVRKAGTNDAYVGEVYVNPGHKADFKIKVSNIDGAVAAKDVKVQDIFPEGLTLNSAVVLRRSNGQSSVLLAGIEKGGVVAVSELKAGDYFELTFTALTSASLKNDACLVNKVIASAPNARGPVEATAKVCILEVGKVTPSPTASPVLPTTGPAEVGLALMGGLAVSTTSAAAYLSSRRRSKTRRRRIEIL